jgi:hypothetical protein
MSKRLVASLAGILIAANCAFAQDLQAQPVPADEPAPAPYAGVAEPAGSVADGPLSSIFGGFAPERRGIITAEAEFMLWFVSNAGQTLAISAADILGATNIGDLSGVENGKGPVSGGRFTFGYWQTEDNPWVPGGIRDRGGEARFFFVGSRSGDISTTVPPTLFRPFFDLNDRTILGFLVASPGIATGGINAHAQIDMWGAEANFWKNVYYNKPGTTTSIDVMAGFRYLNSNTAVDINSISAFSPTIPAGTTFAAFAGNQLSVLDSFATHNNFYGGQVGIKAKTWFADNLMSLEGSFRVALGTTSEDLTIAGSQIRTFANGTTAVSNGGLLALPSNIGNHHTSQFAQVPELEFKFVYPVGNHLEFSTSVSALYWSKVLRAADQIDRSIDITQIPNFPLAAGATPTGLTAPGVPFTQSALWIVGLSLGVEVKW